MDVRVGLQRKLSIEELMDWILVLEKTLKSPLDCKTIQPVNSKGNQSWIFIGRTDAEAETPIFWPPDVKNWLLERPWCWERLKAGRQGDNRRWDDWMASLTQCMWVCVSSRNWWWTVKSGMVQSRRSQNFGHDWVTELTELTIQKKRAAKKSV